MLVDKKLSKIPRGLAVTSALIPAVVTVKMIMIRRRNASSLVVLRGAVSKCAQLVSVKLFFGITLRISACLSIYNKTVIAFSKGLLFC